MFDRQLKLLATMRNSIKWIVGVGVLVALIGLLWNTTEERPEPRAPSVALEPHSVVQPPALPPMERVDLIPSQEPTEPAAIIDEPEAPLPPHFAWAPPPSYEFGLRGEVHDVWLEPQPAAKVYVAIDGERFTRCAALDQRGSFQLHFEANQQRVSVHVFVHLDGSRVRGIETFDLVAGEWPYVILDLLDLDAKCGSSDASSVMSQSALGGPVQRVEPGGRTRFVALDNVGPTQLEERKERSGGSRSGRRAKADCAARGRITTPTGEAAVGARVQIMSSSGGKSLSTTTNYDGLWQFDEVNSGQIFLSAGGDDFGLATSRRYCLPGKTLSWNAELDREGDVRGQLLGPDNEPLPFLVRAEGTSQRELRWRDMTIADDEGRFGFPNARARTMRFFVIDPTANPIGIPLYVDDTLRRDQAERVIKLTPSALERASVSIRLIDGAGEPVQNAEVRLLHAGTKRGVFLKRSSFGGAQGRYSVSGLPLGLYRLEAIAPELGSIAIGEIEARSKGDIDLGVHYFNAPGTLRVNQVGLGLERFFEWRITQRGRVVNALVWAGPNLGAPKRAEATGGTVQLPVGDYLLSLRTESVGNLSYPFQIVSGIETTLNVGYSEPSEITLQHIRGPNSEYVILDEATGTEVRRKEWNPKSAPWKLQLMPGFYRAWAPGHSGVNRQFEVKPDSPLTVALR